MSTEGLYPNLLPILKRRKISSYFTTSFSRWLISLLQQFESGFVMNIVISLVSSRLTILYILVLVIFIICLTIFIVHCVLLLLQSYCIFLVTVGWYSAITTLLLLRGGRFKYGVITKEVPPWLGQWTLKYIEFLHPLEWLKQASLTSYLQKGFVLCDHCKNSNPKLSKKILQLRNILLKLSKKLLSEG